MGGVKSLVDMLELMGCSDCSKLGRFWFPSRARQASSILVKKGHLFHVGLHVLKALWRSVRLGYITIVKYTSVIHTRCQFIG